MFKLEEVEKLRDTIEEGKIKDLLDNYYKSLKSILYTANVPFLCMMAGYEKAMLKFLPLAEAGKRIPDLFKNEKKDPKTEAIELVQHFEKKIMESMKEGESVMGDKLVDFITNDEQFRNAYYSIIHGTLVNTWTIFEAISKDLWRFILNNFPDKFFHSVVNSKDKNFNSIEGLSGKQISVALLSKYEFNLSNSLGDLISPRYDFTSPKGIKSAYKHLFNCDLNDLNFLDNRHLLQLENIRHLMVHNAGTIDEEYLKRSTYENEELGEDLRIEANQLDDLINSNIDAIIGLFKLVNNKL